MVPDGSPVKKGDVVVRIDPSGFEKELDQGISEKKISAQRVSRAKVERKGKLNNLERDVAMSNKELDNSERFQSRDGTIYSRMEIIESEIDTNLARHKTDHAKSSKTTQDQLSTASIELIQIEQRQAQLSIDRAQQGLNELNIVAPHDGIVVFSRDFNGKSTQIGDTVWPGREIASIPDLGEMQAEVYVLEADAGGLEVGQAASVVIEAFPQTPNRATVKQVDPVAQPRMRGLPVQYFKVILELEKTDRQLMKPGQRVIAKIVLVDLDNGIAIPLHAVSEVDGETMVYRRKGWVFEAVRVELGSALLGRVIVTSGLEHGDIIALSDPYRAPVRQPGNENGAEVGGAS
jgi:RND family efflux transporter MFP subunit